MDIPGQKYYVSDSVDISVPTEGGAVDLFAITAAANVPLYLEFANVNCGVDAAQIQEARLVKRTTAGSGGVALTVRNESPAGPAASFAANAMVTVPGSLEAAPVWSEDWQQFAAMEVDKRERGVLVVPGETIALMLPSVAAAFTCNINLTVHEVK